MIRKIKTICTSIFTPSCFTFRDRVVPEGTYFYLHLSVHVIKRSSLERGKSTPRSTRGQRVLAKSEEKKTDTLYTPGIFWFTRYCWYILEYSVHGTKYQV